MERTSPFRPMSSYGRPRLRSQSPSRGALAIDMRRIASLLRDPGAALHTGESMNNSICSSPNSAWEPGDRGAAPTATPVRAVSLSRTVMQNQFSALAERINAGVTALQRQCETDRRRLAQLEKKFEARVADSEKHEGRERWAEVQGSVSGLLEETQALARRLDGLDERLWARTGGSEASKQRHREIEQQVQALEQASRLSAAAQEELQKRQATKIRRTEHSVEEVLRRLASLEDEVRQRSAPQREGYLDGKLQGFEQNQEALDAEIRALQANLEDGLQQLREEFAGGASEGAEHGNAFEAARKADQGLCSLERKLTGQVEDVSSTVASLRVKVDGLLSRVGGLAERLETAHEPSLSSLRQELSAARQQERQQLDAELQALRGRLQAAQEGQEEAFSELREALRQARAEAAALSYRPDVGEESGWMRSTEERLAAHEQELFDLRDRELTEEGKAKGPELEELRRRLEWLEEGAEKPETGRAAVQNSICELVEQVSKLKQQAASAEANASSWQQQVKQIHSLIERKQNEDAASLRVTGEVEARVGALSSQVADIAARLLEVEGNLDFVREPSLEATRSCEGQAAAPNGLQEKLEAVAIHLEVVDDLSDRLAELERQLKPERGSPQPMSEVSFGGEAPVRPTEGLGLSDLQLRLDAGDQKMKALQEELRTKLALSKAEGQQASTQLADLASRLGALEALGAPCSMADLDALRLELSDKEDLKPSELVEVRQELQELAEKVRGEMKAELKELRAHLPDKDAEASAEEAILEKLEEVDGKIKGFQKELAARPADGLKAELADLRQEQLAFQNDCEEKMNVWTKEQGHLKNRVSELRQLAEDVEHASELRKELKHLKLVVQEECLAHAFVPELRADVNALLQRPKAAPQASNELSELKEQVLALEQRLSEGGESEDLKARSQVQQQAQDLTLQLSKEVANLAETQKELVEANTTLEDMGRRLSELSALKSELEGTQRRGESGEKLLESLVKELRGVAERLQTVEGHGAELKRELQAVRVGPKVGISSGKESFLEEVQERLELLSEQVADLQSRQEAQAAPAAQRRHDSLASGDGSLNFSLTEQTERPGAAEGSLNFSLTEPRRGSDAEELERKPKNLYINAEADSDAGAEILSAGDSPASARGHEAKSADSLLSPKDASSSQVSASLNELSVYADHSVELSTELDEKCDFVEPVRKPLTLASAPIAEEPKEEEAKPSLASKQLAADALDALLRPKAKTLPPLEGKPKEATPMSKVEEESKEAKKEEVKPEVKEEVKKEEEKKEDSEKEDEYDDNSFDDNMSVPESIQEDSEMGSDAGSQDAV